MDRDSACSCLGRVTCGLTFIRRVVDIAGWTFPIRAVAPRLSLDLASCSWLGHSPWLWFWLSHAPWFCFGHAFWLCMSSDCEPWPLAGDGLTTHLILSHTTEAADKTKVKQERRAGKVIES